MTSAISPEVRRFNDSSTSRPIIQWTNHTAKSQHLYFTSPSITLDDRWLVFLSERDGGPNLYRIDRATEEITPLTTHTEGLLRSYVYPMGGLRGLSKASPCLDPIRNILYYIANDAVWSVSIADGERRHLTNLPSGWWTAYTHISPDGLTFCVTCTPPEAFPEGLQDQWTQLRTAPCRMKEGNLRSRIYRIDVATGQIEIWAEPPFWVTHVQFDPKGSGRLIFNQEGFHPDRSVQIPDRIWCLEPDGQFRRLFNEPLGSWATHENWSPTGEFIVYHGQEDGILFVAARTWDGKLVYRHSMEGIRPVHVTMDLTGRRFFIDQTEGMILQLAWEEDQPILTPVCHHDSSMKDQDAHVHPIITPHGRSVVFTSDRGGTCNVYEVSLEEKG